MKPPQAVGALELPYFNGKESAGGYVLGIVLLVLAAIGVLIAASMSGVSFQSDLAHHQEEKARARQAAQAAISMALETLMQGNPGIERSRALGNALLVGTFDSQTGAISISSQCDAGAHDCLCTEGVSGCIDFYVETWLLRCSAAVDSSLERYSTLYHRVSATATGYSGSSATLAVEVSGTYEGYCP